MDKLQRCRLGDLVDVTRGMSLPGEYYSTEGLFIRLTLGNFDYARGGFKANTSKDNIYYSGDVRKEFILNKGDIITPLTEQTPGLLGSTARIPESGKYIQSQDIALIKCKPDLIDPSFCYYLVSSSSVRKQLGAAAQQTKIRHTSPDKIKDVIVDIPSLEEQIKIGHILDTITAVIDNARTIIDNLDGLARQLFDYWFVQFDFPDKNGKPYKSSGGEMVWNENLKREIPLGWEWKKLGNLIQHNRGVSYTGKDISDVGTPIISLASIDRSGRYIPEGIKYYSQEYAVSKVLKPFDLVMANTDMTQERAVMGRIIFVPDIFDGDILSTHHITQIRTDEDLKSYLMMTTQTDWFHNYIKGFSSGTNVLGLDMIGFEDYLLLIPEKEILSKFNDYIIGIYKEIFNVYKNSFELSSLRDFLLPLLINGQVCVKE